MELFLFFSILGLTMACALAYFITDIRDIKTSRATGKNRPQPQQVNSEG